MFFRQIKSCCQTMTSTTDYNCIVFFFWNWITPSSLPIFVVAKSIFYYRKYGIFTRTSFHVCHCSIHIRRPLPSVERVRPNQRATSKRATIKEQTIDAPRETSKRATSERATNNDRRATSNERRATSNERRVPSVIRHPKSGSR